MEDEDNVGQWVAKPCMGCEGMVEDLVEEPDDENDWYCTDCWPAEETKRLKADVLFYRTVLKAILDKIPQPYRETLAGNPDLPGLSGIFAVADQALKGRPQ